jgi:hypothetical protein
MRANDDKEIAYLSFVSSQKNSMREKFLFTLMSIIALSAISVNVCGII